MHNGLVVEGGAFVFAQADEHHLVQAALDLADEVCVRFDAADDGDVVGFIGVFVEEYGNAVFGLADLHRFHRCLDRRAGIFLGDAIAFDDGLLSLGDTAAVAAHCRNQKGL